MTEPDYRALCAEILKLLDYYIPQDDRLTCWDSWRDRARAALNEGKGKTIQLQQQNAFN